MARRIGGDGGGSDKGDKGSGAGTVLLAAGVAVVLGAGGTTAVSAGVLGSEASASVRVSSGARGQSKVNRKNSEAVKVKLSSRGIRLNEPLTDDADDCVEHSYGRVREFFRDNPCVGLHRALFELRDRNGDVVLLAVSWVDMPDESYARSLHQLLDRDGTGNVTELSRERGRYRSVRFTGDFYASHRDGSVVVNAQAQPVARGSVGLALTSILTDVVR